MTESELERAPQKAAVLVAAVRVNGVDFTLSAPCSVSDLLAQLGMQGKRVAVSVNRSVIPRSGHPEAPVRAGDRIEILEAVGGG